jgi:hypothetical protein
MIVGIGLWTFLRALFTGASAVALENLACPSPKTRSGAK